MKRIVPLLLCLLCLLLSGCGKKQTESNAAEPLPTQKVNSLLYYNGSTTLRFASNEDGKWVWSDGEKFPLDDSTVRQIVDRLPEILAAEPKTDVTDLSACGLAEPTCYLTVGSDDETRTLYFGNRATSGSWYMRVADSSGVYQIPDDFKQLLDQDIYDMAVLPTLPELTEDMVTFIGVSRSEEENTYLLHADGAWKSNGKDVADMAKRILSELESMELERCVDYFPADGVSELCGLTEGATKITLKYVNSVGSESELLLTVGGLMETEEGYYLTVGESDAIYCMRQSPLRTLLSLLPKYEDA